MNKAKRTGNWILNHKCIVFLVFFVAEIGFFDHNSLLSRYRIHRQISEMTSELHRYCQITDNANKQLKDLAENPEAIEKIARERYFMKADDEDIYVLEYPDKDNGGNN